MGELCFVVVKRIFGFAKVRYRGIAKNAERPNITYVLMNLFLQCSSFLRQL